MSTNPFAFPRNGNRRGIGGKRADLGDMYFRSSWEANYARYLNLLKRAGEIIEWSYEPQTFEFKGIKRGSRFYTPDFLITERNGTQVFHEVKGYMDSRSATKLKRMKKYHPLIVVELIDKHRYRAIAKKVRGLIPTWEGKK